ncbi:peptidase M19 [Meiothermus sp. QL-1]|uniref:dipeptidase n=1 Tax=Meiothermus sp. QL-1 TaxID=2058095 RepID=UPI000E0B01C4|nr:membrane dipeptidase [Meiothermus sp. QL-1]RDI96458.1 peptidase M19 [Meiothermus sp. QL-1]
MMVDAHLDLAYNALELGRDLTLPLAELRRRDTCSEVPLVTLPALREAGVGVVFATLWVDPRRYPTPEEAHRAALRQLELYLRWEEAGWVRILRRRADLVEHRVRWQQDRAPALVLLIEGAECVRVPEEVAFWWGHGVRLIAPAWNRTRYAGGTREPGGLTPLGQELLWAMQAQGVALDCSHLDEAAFWQALAVFGGALCATHSNPRALLGGEANPLANRHLSDAMLRALGAREGVVGVVLYNLFLDPAWRRGQPRLPLAVVGRHLAYVAAQVGWERVGLGSDFDGGFGLHEAPLGLEGPADLGKLAGWVPEPHRPGVLGENWLGWLARALPA